VYSVECGDGLAEDALPPPGPRSVVAGIAGKVALGDLLGTRVVCLTNQKPVRMRGIESAAMLLASDDGDRVELLAVPEGVKDGELLEFEGYEKSAPDDMLKSKGAVKVWDRVKEGLSGTEDGHAAYNIDGKTCRIMTNKGPVTSIANADIQ